MLRSSSWAMRWASSTYKPGGLALLLNGALSGSMQTRSAGSGPAACAAPAAAVSNSPARSRADFAKENYAVDIATWIGYVFGQEILMTDLTSPMFHDDKAARAHFEGVLWPNGPVCPHCKATENLTRLQGKSHRPGLFQCNACRGHFTVMNGSIMERSHVPLHKWALAFHLMASSKKGMSAHQLHRMLEINYRTAWFMEHRIRECMTRETNLPPMGGEGQTVEIDETFIGQKKDMPKQRGYAHKHAVMTLVQRGGSARSFHVDGTKATDLLPIIKANVLPGTRVMTDEAGQYAHLNKHFDEHQFVSHGTGEYVRGDAHTNTAEGASTACSNAA